jgi:hypothetical protein
MTFEEKKKYLEAKYNVYIRLFPDGTFRVKYPKRLYYYTRYRFWRDPVMADARRGK